MRGSWETKFVTLWWNLPEGHPGYEIPAKRPIAQWTTYVLRSTIQGRVWKIVETYRNTQTFSFDFHTPKYTYTAQLAVDTLCLDDRHYTGNRRAYLFYIPGYHDTCYTHFSTEQIDSSNISQGEEIFVSQLQKLIEYTESHPDEQTHFREAVVSLRK